LVSHAVTVSAQQVPVTPDDRGALGSTREVALRGRRFVRNGRVGDVVGSAVRAGSAGRAGSALPGRRLGFIGAVDR
jgi:hypothetical protein